jgi:hypothetical protein
MSNTASVTASASSTSVFTIADQSSGRTVFNDSAAVLYLKFGATASETDYTVQIPAGGFYEFPEPVFSGEVDGIWSSATGNARTTRW